MIPAGNDVRTVEPGLSGQLSHALATSDDYNAAHGLGGQHRLDRPRQQRLAAELLVELVDSAHARAGTRSNDHGVSESTLHGSRLFGKWGDLGSERTRVYRSGEHSNGSSEGRIE